MKEITINTLICASALFLVSFCAELVIRLNPHLYCVGYRPSKNDKIVYEFYPGYKIKSINAEINSQGLNDRYFPVEKEPGVFRIAVVGDSVSFGWKVGAENSFPKILERMLNEKSDKKIEVINFSVPGYNTSQEFEILKEKVIKFKPDMIMLVYSNNDTHICNYFKPKTTFSNYLYNKSYLIHFFLRGIDSILPGDSSLRRIWLYFKKNVLGMFYYNEIIYPYPGLEQTIYIRGNPPNSKKYVPPAYWYMLGYENYTIHLSNIYNWAREHNIKFISGGDFDKEAFRINQELGIENILNFSEALASEGNSAYICFPEDLHWSMRGHHLIAEYLYGFLADEFKL